MTIIADLSDFIEDELDAVVNYADMAVHYKSENKELADLLFNMANSEATHLRNLHVWIVKLIDKTKKEMPDKIPQGMIEAWSYKHKKLAKKFNRAEATLQNYSKM